LPCSFVEILCNPEDGKRRAGVESVLAVGELRIGFLAKKVCPSSEHVFRKLEETKFEMELSRTMDTRVANWKGWKKM
jgi:hypothetical protein